jgi:6-phospho-3-hexuloisomerase
MFSSNHPIILNEIRSVLVRISDKEVEDLIREIQTANKIVLHGAGRVGMAVRGFAMRLGHMGYKVYTLGDSTVPSIADGDLAIIASGSGETQTTYDIAMLAKKNNSKVVAITGNSESRIAKLADLVVILPAPSKTKMVNGMLSQQPMTTLNEQCLGIFFDSVVLDIMKVGGFTHETMWKNHSNLE